MVGFTEVGMSRTKGISIAGRYIGAAHPPLVIAEMSGNHNCSLDRALKIVDAAGAAGAHAFKIQTYTGNTMTLDLAEGDFLISDPKSPWYGRALYDLYQEAHTPWEWHQPIFSRARELGMIPFSTPFDESSVLFLESLDVPCYKIASFENTDLPLLRKIAATEKPVIMSIGMASLAELGESVATLRRGGCKDLILLKCTSTYPASPANSNLNTIPHLRDMFQCEVGLSDHTLGLGVSIGAVALGAAVIEKHFTLSRSEGGVDAAFSLEPLEFKSLVAETTRAWQALGDVTYEPTSDEKPSLQFRRSIYAVSDIRPGDLMNERNVRVIRPGHGLEPKYYDLVLGKKARRLLKRGDPVTWDVLVEDGDAS